MHHGTAQQFCPDSKLPFVKTLVEIVELWKIGMGIVGEV